MLLLEVRKTGPRVRRVGELTPLSLVCHVVACVRERCPPPPCPLATCVRQESWPCPSLALAPGRLRHALLLGSTLELNLLVGALVLWVREQESCPCPSLIYHVVVWAREVGNSPLSHLLPPATGRRAGLQAREQKNWPCPSPTEAVWKQGPAAYLDKQ